uniref:Uncharacterized protein n=1 Tax=Anguilla anguilla TaxID=7936 RepID=A0A0E9V7K4_ANGAN
MNAIFSWTFSGGSTILSVWSVATKRVSMFCRIYRGLKTTSQKLSIQGGKKNLHFILQKY